MVSGSAHCVASRHTSFPEAPEASGLADLRACLYARRPMTVTDLLAPFSGPYWGVPPFDRVEPGAFPARLREAIEAQRVELAAIVADPAPPTFSNTIVAFEDSGRALRRVGALLGVYTSTMADATVQAVETEVMPMLAAFGDEVTQDAGLYARVAAVYAGREGLGLSVEEGRLLELVYRGFVRRGAGLERAAQVRLAEINQRLAARFTTFTQNLLADESVRFLHITDEAALAGLSAAFVAGARAEAAARELAGWVVSNTRSSAEPFLTYATRRDLREQVFAMWASRGEHDGPHDNRPIVTEILALRAERARILGYASHAHWIIDDNMARTPEVARALLLRVWPAAVARVRVEVADMEALAGHPIAPHDYRYYAEQVRKQRYDLDEAELSPFLDAERLREGMFWAAERLHGLRFAPISDVPVYHPDVRVWRVERDGQHVGLWYFDPYARAGKRSGAWMSEYRTQETFATPTAPIVSNNANFVRGQPGAPVLVSWDDAVTMFHEFGHALHGLSSVVRFPSLAGTNTKRDFVELPSQLNERWLLTNELLERFARHHETGAPMPAALVQKITRARDFNQGWKTVEYLLAAFYDLDVHSLPEAPADPIAFERDTRAALGAPAEVIARHRPPHFAHVFADDGYSAGYYSYLWADALTADAAEAFIEAGGFYDAATAKRYLEHILAVGDSIAPDEAFRRFRGRDVDPDALMRQRGFTS